MADEQKPKARKKPTEPAAADGVAATPVKTKGGGAGKAAPVEVVAEPAPAKPQTKSTKTPKLAKKNKSRLPRRQKKALQKAAARKG